VAVSSRACWLRSSQIGPSLPPCPAVPDHEVRAEAAKADPGAPLELDHHQRHEHRPARDLDDVEQLARQREAHRHAPASAGGEIERRPGGIDHRIGVEAGDVAVLIRTCRHQRQRDADILGGRSLKCCRSAARIRAPRRARTRRCGQGAGRSRTARPKALRPAAAEPWERCPAAGRPGVGTAEARAQVTRQGPRRFLPPPAQRDGGAAAPRCRRTPARSRRHRSASRASRACLRAARSRARPGSEKPGTGAAAAVAIGARDRSGRPGRRGTRRRVARSQPAATRCAGRRAMYGPARSRAAPRSRLAQEAAPVSEPASVRRRRSRRSQGEALGRHVGEVHHVGRAAGRRRGRRGRRWHSSAAHGRQARRYPQPMPPRRSHRARRSDTSRDSLPRL
jgi:hypothetical protein